MGQDVSVIKDDVSAVKHYLRSAKEDITDSSKSVKEEVHLYQASLANSEGSNSFSIAFACGLESNEEM